MNADEAPTQVQSFLVRLDPPKTTFIDHGDLWAAVHLSGYSTTFVIDQRGNVTAQHFGPLTPPPLQALLHHVKDPLP